MNPTESDSRPAGNGPATKSLNDDAASVQGTKDFLAYLAEPSGPDDPTFRAASLLADAWGPALDRSYRLGWENGYAAGFYEAEKDMAEAWAKAARPIRAALAQPTWEQLQRRRGECVRRHRLEVCTCGEAR